MPGKRSPEDLWRALEKEAREPAGADKDLADGRSKKTSAIEKELADAGFDVEAEKAEARAWAAEFGKVGSGHPSKPPDSLAQVRSMRPSARPSAVPWIAAAAVVLLVGGTWLVQRLAPDNVGPTTYSTPASLRREGMDACHAGRWAECLNRFDAAKGLDPAGDADPAVQTERAKAREALAAPK